MKTFHFSTLVALLAAAFTLLSCSSNKENEIQNIVSIIENVDSFYAPSVLRSGVIDELPAFSSKEKIVKVALDLAKDKFNTEEVQITDLYLYPELGGLEFFYMLPNGIESNAFLVDINSLGDLEFEADQFEFPFDEINSDLSWGANQSSLMISKASNDVELGSLLFTCDNKHDCSPCKVIVTNHSEISEVPGKTNEPKATIKCGSCEGCALKVEFF